MINKEDKKDVARHLGKALAKKVASATNDRKHKFAATGSLKWTDREARGISKLIKSRHEEDIKSGNYVKLSYNRDTHESGLSDAPISIRANKSGTTHHFYAAKPKGGILSAREKRELTSK